MQEERRGKNLLHFWRPLPRARSLNLGKEGEASKFALCKGSEESLSPLVGEAPEAYLFDIDTFTTMTTLKKLFLFKKVIEKAQDLKLSKMLSFLW